MKNSTLSISILTPTWNRARYLERVWNGLASQTIKDFEWIVADDGSTDDTEQVIRGLAAQSDFPVVYIKAVRRVGKARIDNEAIKGACGNFILWCDSDDYLLPNALEWLLETWNSIPTATRDNYVGITALCATDNGPIEYPFPDLSYHDVPWNDLAEVHGVTGDMLFFTRANALKAHLFPEVDFVIPESVVWTAIGHHKSRLIPEVLKIVEYQTVNGISFSGKMEYNRGRAYAMAITVRNLASYPRSLKIRWWRLVTFIRYSIHGEIGYRESQCLWRDNSSRLAFWLATPLAWLLACKDVLQGKVVKSHRDFLAANNGHTSITAVRLNGN